MRPQVRPRLQAIVNPPLRGIIEIPDLRRPICRRTTTGGHLLRVGVAWEANDATERLLVQLPQVALDRLKA